MYAFESYQYIFYVKKHEFCLIETQKEATYTLSLPLSIRLLRIGLPSKMSNHHKELEDKLLIELLDLVEQSVISKLNIEQSNNNGQLWMAKARYCQGPQSVAESKLPTENSAEFSALRTVELTDNSDQSFNMQTAVVDKSTGFVDPLKWFGILVPRSLQVAQQTFIKSLDFVIEAANLQLKLQKTISNLLALRQHSLSTQ